MKRPSQDVAGRPKVPDARSDVAGRSFSRNQVEFASYCRALHDPASTAADDAALIEDFADFLGGGGDFEAEAGVGPDPAFQERLRRRLWRNFVVSHIGNAGKETH
jgi:hypothetical protein